MEASYHIFVSGGEALNANVVGSNTVWALEGLESFWKRVNVEGEIGVLR